MGFTLGMQVAIVEGLRSIVQTDHLTAVQWIICLGIAVISLPVGYIMKLIPIEDAPKHEDPGIKVKKQIRNVLAEDEAFDSKHVLQNRSLHPDTIQKLADFVNK